MNEIEKKKQELKEQDPISYAVTQEDRKSVV